ncbi:MAG: arylsulfatase [Planctomycetaceae bacterium]|nr:arylsulfatase [Planctomycetaceae bacterium]
MSVRRLALASFAWIACLSTTFAAEAAKPNIVFILADDLGYADLGCYGGNVIQTPRLDAMASEGLRFTHAYAGTSVCAPTRCVLMTGLHTGHAPIRANRELQPEGQMPLPEGYVTLPQIMKDAGYATACIGKWGLGVFGSTGDPLKRGFDHFYGYNCQRHAHEYYTDYLYDDDRRIALDGKTYSQDLLMADALAWVREKRDETFFLYLPFTIPHGKYQVPDASAYDDATFEGRPLTEQEKTYAAMVSRLDGDVGRLLDLLKELQLDEKTIVFFTSDHGAAKDFFHSSGPLRDIKRSMYEGGLRVPMIVRWPDVVPAGKVSDEVWTFWDVLPTFAELAGTSLPEHAQLDGLSVVPALLGGEAPRHDYLYWELHEGKFSQAAIQGQWKAVRPGPNAALELYDLAADPGETNDVAATHPDEIAAMERLLREARSDSPLWPKDLGAKKKAANAKPAS